MIAGPQDTPSGQLRLEGFREAMGRNLDPDLIAYGDYSIESGAHAMAQLLSRMPLPTAVFAASDSMAAGAIRTLRGGGHEVPRDCAVAGFDDSGLAEVHDPSLTTMAQPWAEISNQMVQMLLDRVAGGPVRHVRLETRLVVRSSA